MKLGFAGLGRMGELMARNLAEAGFSLVLWTRNVTKAEALGAELGLDVARTPAALAERSDVVLTMLYDDAASRAVHFGEDGLFASDHPKYFIEMGTMSPAHIEELAAGASAGAQVIDAPVSGATQAAHSRALLFMVGADETTIEPLAEIFDAMGKSTMPLGACGHGATMKLAVNAMIHGINQNFSEALNVAKAAGIDPTSAFDVIEASAACPPMLNYRRPIYLQESEEVTFTIALARKDMGLFEDLARQFDIHSPLGAVVLDELQRAESAGFAEQDMAAMLQFNGKETR